jgi:hypothetical protein
VMYAAHAFEAYKQFAASGGASAPATAAPR